MAYTHLLFSPKAPSETFHWVLNTPLIFIVCKIEYIITYDFVNYLCTQPIIDFELLVSLKILLLEVTLRNTDDKLCHELSGTEMILKRQSLNVSTKKAISKKTHVVQFMNLTLRKETFSYLLFNNKAKKIDWFYMMATLAFNELTIFRTNNSQDLL